MNHINCPHGNLIAVAADCASIEWIACDWFPFSDVGAMLRIHGLGSMGAHGLVSFGAWDCSFI